MGVTCKVGLQAHKKVEIVVNSGLKFDYSENKSLEYMSGAHRRVEVAHAEYYESHAGDRGHGTCQMRGLLSEFSERAPWESKYRYMIASVSSIMDRGDVLDSTSKRLEGSKGCSLGVGDLSKAPKRRDMLEGSDGIAIKNGNLMSHALRGVELHQASAQLQRAVAFLGGVLLAGMSQATQHVARSGHRLRRNATSSFSDSFSFPWKPRHRERETKKGSIELAANLAARGMEYERSLDVRAAVQCFEEAVKLSPGDLVCLCMAAKQWSDLTFYHDVATDRERQVVNLKALEYAERAISHHPDSPGGYLGACISKGRLGLFMDNRTKVKLAKEAREAAQTAINLGPDNDIAHHLMGRWHYEMSKLNVVVRTIVRVMYGTELQPGTKEDALKSYNKAIELAPERLVHKVEAGRVLLELGQKEDAKKILEAALECDVEDINAWQTRFDAEMLLAQINRRPWVRPSLVPPGIATSGTSAALSTSALLGLSEKSHS